MEGIYLKHFVDNGWHSKKIDLASYFKSYSKSYSTLMKRKNMNLLHIFQSVCGEDSKMEIKDMRHFIKDMSELQKEFKTFSLDNLAKRRKLMINKEKSVVSKKKNLKGVGLQSKKSFKNHHANLGSETQADSTTHEHQTQKLDSQAADVSQSNTAKEVILKPGKTKKTSSPLPKLKPTLNTLRVRELLKTRKGKYKKRCPTTRGEILLEDDINYSKRENLKVGQHFIVSFRIHRPFAHRVEKNKVENCQQEIRVVGHQTLEELRDKIVCQADFQDVRGDVSNDPDSLVTELTRDKYKSAMFYFDNTFYIDERGDQDYSVVIREWALSQGIKVGVTRYMATTRVSDLRVRFGYPYVYMHQGGCEHLVIISDARLLTRRDSLDSRNYPLISHIARPITTYCFTCLKMPAKWIVIGCERLPHDNTYMCKKCFTSFNYVDGKKVGNFKAYRYFQKNLLL